MYNYSPIKKLVVKNFRNIGDVEIDFSESPIVSLIGENEAGKTSIVKAFAVCALNATPRDQKDYIRDGTNGFGVQVELEDGTCITRMKTPTLNYYRVQKADGTDWEANKLDAGIPLAVKEVMGMTEEPETKEFLHIRTYEDQLLFVVTPASTNYKVMYDALKVEQLTKAIKAGSKEVNALKATIDTDEHGVQTLTASLRGIRTHDIEPLLNIKARLVKEVEDIKLLQRAAEISNRIDQCKAQLGALVELERGEIGEVSEVEVQTIHSISNITNNIHTLRNRLNTLNQVDTLGEIDTYDLSNLISISNRVDDLRSKESALGAYGDLGNADEIDEITIISLQNTSNLVHQINIKKLSLHDNGLEGAKLIEQSDFDAILTMESIVARKARNQQMVDTVKQYDNYCMQVEAYIKSQGVDVEICPNCGESIIVDLDKYSQPN